MYETLKIIRQRWAEVLLILFFSCGAILLMLEHEKNTNAGGGFSFLMAIVIGTFMVLGYIFQIGFLRTVVFDAERGFAPKELLMIGRVFLWRIVGFSIIFGIVVFVVTNAILSFMMMVFSDVESSAAISKQLEQMPEWYPVAAMFIAFLMTVKFWLFVPALIIVKNCRLIESLKMIKSVKLLRAGEVLLWLGLILVFNSVGVIADSYITLNGNIETAITGSTMFASSFLAFGMQIAAVKYVKQINTSI